MFLFLSASRCKAQLKLFSQSCRVPAVLKDPETKGRKLQEPQTELTRVYNSLYKQIRSSIPLNSAHCSMSPCQYKQEGMPWVQHPGRWNRDVQSSVLYSAPLITWVSLYILNIYSERNQSPSTNWFPSKLGVCYMPLLSSSNFTGPHWCFPPNCDSSVEEREKRKMKHF